MRADKGREPSDELATIRTIDDLRGMALRASERALHWSVVKR